MERKNDANLDPQSETETSKGRQNTDKKNADNANESETSNDGLLSQDQIAALFNSQEETASSENQPAITEATNLAPSTDATTVPSPNKILTPEEIANLIAAQTINETPAPVEASAVSEPELEPELEATPEPAPNKILTPEEIANLFAAQSIDETPAPIDGSATSETEPEPTPEPTPNKILSPEEIANLFAAQTINETPEPVEASAVSEPELEPELEATPEPAPNKILTPEEIANLFAAQSIDETPAPIDGSATSEPETEPTPEPAPNKTLTPEEIANLFAAQSIDETPAPIDGSATSEPEPEPTPEPAPNKILSPEEIANLIAQQTIEETPAPIEASTSSTTPEPINELATSSDGMISQDQIAALFDVQTEASITEDSANQPISVPLTDSNKILSPDEIANLIAQQTIDETPAPIDVSATSKPESEPTPDPAPNKILTPEEIANLIAQQTIDETPAPIDASTTSEPEPVPTPEPAPNKILSPEEIANLIAQQVIDETPAPIDVTATSEPEPEPTPEPAPNKILTPEEIANLIAQQTIEETPAPIEASTSSTVPEPLNELATSSDGMISQDQIAALFDVQTEASITEDSANQPISVPLTDSNKILSPDEIANLIAQQTIDETPAPIDVSATSKPESEPTPDPAPNKILTPEEIANLIAQQTIDETPAPIDASTTSGLEPVPTPEPAPNKILSPEEIANLFAAQSIDETPKPIDVSATSETEPEPTPEPAPNKILSPEEIANLIAQQVIDETPAPIDVTATSEPEPEPTPEPAPNKILTPEEIANLIAQQTIEETPAPIEASTSSTMPEPLNELATSSDGIISQDQIAALFDVQTEATITEDSSNQPVSVPLTDSNTILSPDEIANLIAQQTIEETTAPIDFSATSEPTPEPEPEPTPEPIEASTSSTVVSEPNNELATSSDGMISQDQIATLFDVQTEASITEDSGNLIAEQRIDETPESVEASAPTESEPKTDSPPKKNFIQTFKNTISGLITALLKILPKGKPPKAPEADLTSPSLDPLSEGDTSSSFQNNTSLELQTDDATNQDIPIESPTEKRRKKEKPPKAPKEPKASKAPKEPKLPKTPTQSSDIKIALMIFGVLILMAGSFVAGNISRDFFVLIAPDPAKLAAIEAEKAQEAENAKRAEELAAISPKDYTSSMYLDSIILKGRAGNMTTIKLKKIDDVSKLNQFTKLRRIKLYDMTGEEDLSVIQELSGVEEIVIEDSVLNNQFANGSFKSVKSIEMLNCTINNATQFANFKNVTNLYVDTTKIITEDGNLHFGAYMPLLESLTLIGCGEFGELIGAQNLNQLKSLELSSGTVINKTSYVQNPNIETAIVDISFAQSINQVLALSSLKNIESLIIQVGKSTLSPTELSTAVEQITTSHPDASVSISGY